MTRLEVQERFYRLTPEEFLQVNGLLKDSELRLWLYLSTLMPFKDSEIILATKDIAVVLGFSQRTIQRSLQRLIQLELFDFEVLKAKIKRHQTDNQTEIMHGVTCRRSDTDVAEASQTSPKWSDMSPKWSDMSRAAGESLSQQGFQNSPDYTDYTDYSRSLSDGNSKKENEQTSEENKNGHYIDVNVVPLNGQIKSPLRHSSGLDKFSAAPVCSEKHEYLIYDGENTPWLNVPRRRNDIFFKPEFMEWHGRRWLEKFPNKRDIHEAIADFRSSLLNNPDKIPGRWEEYENHILHHAQNIQIRLEHGCQISESEQQKMIQHLPAINQPVQQEILPTHQQQSLPPIAPEGENAAAYKLFSPPPAQTDISPEEQSENIKKLAELMRSKIKRIPKPKESETENRIDKLNRWLADPILKNEAIRQVLRDDSLIVFFDDNGDPYQVQEK